MPISFLRILSVLCIATFAAAPASAAPKTCANPAEKAALDMRALQTELMVAALSCNESARYNTFVRKYRTELKGHSTQMQRYFTRTADSKAMDRFVTGMANKISTRSWSKTEAPFCQTARNLFVQTLAMEAKDVAKVTAQPRFASLHGVSACATKTPVKKVAAKASRPAAAKREKVARLEGAATVR